ncbi:MAG: carboxypeptidase-like regulatory domain-containing protein [Bacteroidetes bacterium]|nr:carboxypeptidase-like regulatory domain-containing protein [Bacteroidota bacterium]
MSKQLQLTVGEPCHENWEAMTPVEKGRFCAQCQKEVIDFSSMTDRQLSEFFKKPSTGSLCGRFLNEQLDRPIDIPRKRIPWIRYFFQFTLPAFLLSLKPAAAKAQGMVYVKDLDCGKKAADTSQLPAPDTLVPLRGIVKNEKGEPLAGASVFDKNHSRGAFTNDKGEFHLKLPRGSGLRITYIGYRSCELQDITADSVTVTLKQFDESKVLTMGIILPTIVRKKTVKETRPLAVIGTDLGQTLKIFPNPAQSGQRITLVNMNAREGIYQIQISTIAGEIVYQQNERWEKNATFITLQLPFLNTGEYIIQLVNKKTGKNSGVKMIIQ